MVVAQGECRYILDKPIRFGVRAHLPQVVPQAIRRLQSFASEVAVMTSWNILNGFAYRCRLPLRQTGRSHQETGLGPSLRW